MKKLLRYLTLALIASCTTIDEGMDKAEVLQVSTNKMEIEALSSKETFTITSYCDWLAETTYEGNDSKWINLSSTKGQSGTKDVTITFDENKTVDDRYATITVSNARYGLSQSIEIRQKAGEPFILLDKSEKEVVADGEVIELVVNSNINYSVISSESWVKASANSGSKGEKKLSITVDETPAIEVRSATITFSGKEHKTTTTFSIKQQKLEPVIELDTESIKSIASGTTKNVTVESNISWEASCDADWVTITPASGKKGTATTVKVEVAENTKTVAREAVIKVSNAEYKIEKQIAISQEAFSPVLSVSTESISASVEGTTKSVTVEGNISWEASCDADWVTITPAKGAKDTSTLKIEVIANTKTVARDTVVKVFNSEYNIEKQIAVSQAAFNPALNVCTESISAPYAGTTNSITVEGNISWETSCTADWITITPTKGVKGTSTLKIEVVENVKTTARESVVKVFNTEYNLKKQIAISQAAFDPILNVSTESISAPYVGTTNSITIDGNLSWEASCIADWVTITPTKGAKGTSTLKVVVAENTKTVVRESVVKVFNTEYDVEKQITVSQVAFDPTLNVNIVTISAPVEGTTKSVTVDGNLSWEASCAADWMTITPAKGAKGTSTLKVVVAENTKTVARESVVKVFNTEYDVEKQIAVSQVAFNPTLNVSTVSISAPYAGTTKSVTVNGNLSWEASCDADWVTITPTKGAKGTSTLKVVVAENISTSARSAVVKISNSEYNVEKQITISQKALSNAILYTTSDNQVVTPHKTNVFGAKIASNTYEKGVGIIRFDAPVTSIGEEAFYNCSRLASITIPDSVTTIGAYAFAGCSSLTSITIPDSVTTIGDYAFNVCEAITSVTLGKSVEHIGFKAFDDCIGITEITIPDSVKTIDVQAFCYCTGLSSFKGKFASKDGKCLIVNGKLIAFAIGCKNVGKYVIPDGVTDITNYSVYFCQSLSSVVIPESVIRIGEGAFKDCRNLKSVTIGGNVRHIETDAFYLCGSLTSVYCKATTPPAGGSYMFNSNASGRKINVPMESVNAYKSALYWSGYASSIIGYYF